MKTVISAYFLLYTWYSLIMFLMCNEMSKVVENTTFESRMCKYVYGIKGEHENALKFGFLLFAAHKHVRRVSTTIIVLDFGIEHQNHFKHTVQLSNSLFDFVKCKSRSATTAKYRYEI